MSVGWRKRPSDWRERRVDVLPRLCAVGRLLAAAEHPDDATLLVHADDHVRALVDGPDVVVLVDADRMRERPAVQVLADLADELAFRAELQQLGGRGPERRARGAARAREHVHATLRVDCHARHFAEVPTRGELEEVRNGLERDFRCVRPGRRLRTSPIDRRDNRCHQQQGRSQMCGLHPESFQSPVLARARRGRVGTRTSVGPRREDTRPRGKRPPDPPLLVPDDHGGGTTSCGTSWAPNRHRNTGCDRRVRRRRPRAPTRRSAATPSCRTRRIPVTGSAESRGRSTSKGRPVRNRARPRRRMR